MMMPGRNYSAENGYRYGFNGKENDNEVKGEGNQQDYGMRVSDPRLGRFLSLDPFSHTYPWYSPYQFAGNSPIMSIDLDGGEPKEMIDQNSGHVTKPMISLLNAAFGYDIARMENTVWHHTSSRGYFANTVGDRIGYNPDVSNFLQYKEPMEWINYWCNIIVHEMKHRTEYDMGNESFLWQISYGLQTIVWDIAINPDGKISDFYNNDTPPEVRAYRMEDPMVELMNFQNGIVLKVLESTYDENTKAAVLQYVGTSFQLEKANEGLNSYQKKAEKNGRISKHERKQINKLKDKVDALSSRVSELKTEQVVKIIGELDGLEQKKIHKPDIARHRIIRKTGIDPGKTPEKTK